MQSKFKIIFCGMLAILIALWPPFGSPGQNTPPVADSIQQAKQIIRANIDTIRGVNAYIKEKAKEVPELKPVVPPRVFSSWVGRLIRSKKQPVKKAEAMVRFPDVVKTEQLAPVYLDRVVPVYIYQACRSYGGDSFRPYSYTEWKMQRGLLQNKSYRLYEKYLNDQE